MANLPQQEYSDIVQDLLVSNGRALVWTLLLLSLGILFFSGLTQAELISGEMLFLIGWILVISLLALRLLESYPRLAAALWVLGLAVFLALAIATFQIPSLNAFLVVLPFVSIAILGWRTGFSWAAVILILLFSLAQAGIAPALKRELNTTILLASALSAVTGWAAYRSNSAFNYWAFSYTGKSRQVVEEARAHLLELEQTREDLLHANQELSRLSKRLQALQQVAEEARQAKSTFVANVSHELRAPLNLIIGYSQMISRSPQVYGARLPAPLLADINSIWRNSQHLSRLVDDILDLSQAEAGRMTLNREKAALPEVIQEAMSIIQPLFTSKGLYLEAEIPPDLPLLYIDRTRIRQIIINLLSNAGRFTERGGVKITADRQNHELLVRVTDSGPGISPQDLERLFTPFEQLDTSLHRKHGGSGLGLSICKHFVELHGGRIWLESQLDAGTTVFFTLSIDPIPDIPAEIPAATRWVTEFSQPPARGRPWKTITLRTPGQVMVVETGDTLRRVLERYMEGIEVLSAPTVEDAIRQIQHNPVMALLVNTPAILNPEAGRELAQNLSQLPHETPAIACFMPGKVEAMQQLGVQDYLIKPVSAEKLAETVVQIGAQAGTILMVDDDPDVLKLFARILKLQNPRCRLLQATNGNDALELLRERLPDLVLLDLVMEGKDGFQVLEEKRNDASIRSIPVVVISSKDPRVDIASTSTLFIHRAGGLGVGELAQLISAVSGVLTPAPSTGDQAPPGTARG